MMNIYRKIYPKVIIIVLNFNKWDDTLQCVDSLNLIAYPNKEIVVIDNGSTDESANILRNHLKTDTKLICSKENLGYTGGNNIGIKYALSRGADYIHIINNDTVVVNPRYLSVLIDFLESKPEVAVVGPKVYLRNKDFVQNTILPIPSLSSVLLWSIKSRIRIVERELNFSKKISQPCFVDVVNGVCIVVRSQAFKEVGLFDESLFMYGDEIDFCYRLRKQGWKVCYYPIESIIHNQVKRGKNMVSYLYSRRNTVYFFTKHGFKFKAYTLAAGFLIAHLLRILLHPSDFQSYWKDFSWLVKEISWALDLR